MKGNELHTSESETGHLLCVCVFDQTIEKAEPRVRESPQPQSAAFPLRCLSPRQHVLRAGLHKTSHETPRDPSEQFQGTVKE